MATPQQPEHRYNDRIRAREIRLIGSDGSQLGVKPLPEALTLARQQDLDLVEVAPMASPPVCRIMDYGKFRYEESQKAKESRKKTVHVSIKEVKFRPKIGKGDFDTKVRHMQDFLAEGHKVKVTLQFRGREMAHPELGSRILDAVLEQVGDHAKVETQARLEGRNMTMVLAPEKKAPPKKADHSHEHAERPAAAPEPAAPAVVTESPAVATESPAVATESPAVATESPAVATEAPAGEPAVAAPPVDN